MTEILTTNEAAEYLRVSVPTMRGLAASGEIPAAKIGDDWRFVRQHLLNYIVKLAESGQRDRQENPAPVIKHQGRGRPRKALIDLAKYQSAQ